MADAFRLTAKKDIRQRKGSTIVMAKGMSIQHIETSCTFPQPPNVNKTIQRTFGCSEVYIDGINSCFIVEKL